MTRPPGTWPFPGGLDLGRVRAAASAARPARALGASGVAAPHAWLASTLTACCCVLILGVSAASAQTPQASVTVPPDGSTIGIPGPFDPVTGYFGDEPLQGPYFPMSWSCDAESWELTFTSNTTRIGWPAGSTSSVSQQFSPYWREPLRLRGPRDALPDTGTITGIFKCFGFYDPGGDGIISIPFSTTVTYAEGPEGVTPPPGAGGSGGAPGGPGTPGGPSMPGGPGTPGGGPGGQPSPPATCPEAAGLLAGARFWSGLAQRYRGKSVEAGRAVIDYANKANAAFWTVLGDAASSVPEDKITKEVVEELGRKDRLDGYRQLWQNSLNGKWPEISRQLRILRDLQKYFKALGPIGNFEASLQISEALYYLGLAAQQGVLRASWDALADDALARANERQRLAERACIKTASGTLGALAGAAKRAKRKLYTKLSNARSVRGFRVRPGAGLRRGAALALNKLLAGQERTVALAQVVEDSLSRARAAAKARSKKWEARQLRHARATARKLAAHLDAQARRREQTARSLGGQARETTTIEISNPAGWARLLRKLGLPDPITDGLNRLGLRPGPFRRLFIKPPAGQLTVPSLADAVADPAGVARDLALAEDLRSFAAGPY